MGVGVGVCYDFLMNTYIIGDVQGCFDSLQALLRKINFNEKKDRLAFVGDLVNRGPKSLETLRFIVQLKNPLIVLGNHDLHLLALYFLRDHFSLIPHTLQDVLNAPDCEALIYFLLQQPFLIEHNNFVMVHAGIPPQWSVATALQHAMEAKKQLQKNPVEFFKHIYGNFPAIWHDDLPEWDKTRYIINAFTRMRFCKQDGTLDLDNKTVTTDAQFRPWFEWTPYPTKNIVFGHWASLQNRPQAHYFALDTGCVWGGQLTALCVPDFQLICVNACDNLGNG